MTSVYERLKNLQITLPDVPPPVVDGYVAAFVPFVRTGNLIHLSGRLAKKNGYLWCGKLGEEITTADGKQAARSVAIELLATLQAAIGDLNDVRRIVKLLVFVNSGPHFTEAHIVANGASELFIEVFEERGAHARSALGVSQIPFGCCVEIEMVVETNFAPPSGPRFVRFGPFQVDQQRQEIFKNGSRLKLQGKVYQVLLALLEKPGEVVSREELQRLWPADTHANNDANVNTTVNKLRLLLGDSTDKPLYIETIPRKGYCLVMPSEAPNVPSGPLIPNAAPENASASAAPANTTETVPARSGFWIPIGVVGLILAGMLLGAGIIITTLYISHFAQATRCH